MGPCHHGMARPRVADGGDGLQIWSVAAKCRISSRGKPTSGGPPFCELGKGLTTLHRKKKNIITKCHTVPRTWKNPLEKKMSYDCALLSQCSITRKLPEAYRAPFHSSGE
jgi:hypothetical protein